MSYGGVQAGGYYSRIDAPEHTSLACTGQDIILRNHCGVRFEEKAAHSTRFARSGQTPIRPFDSLCSLRVNSDSETRKKSLCFMREPSVVALAEADLETRSLPALARSYPRHFAFYVARPAHSIETRSPPALARSYPRRFAFYVARPAHSILLKILRCFGGVDGPSVLFLAGLEPETAAKTRR